MKLFFSFLVFLVSYVDNSNEVTPQEAEKEVIDNLKIEVKNLAEASVCGEAYNCYSVGIGAKPCGGFWEYVIYSNSIDVVSFLAKIETLNELEKTYNEKYGIISDCYMAMPPSSITCEDGKCTGILQ